MRKLTVVGLAIAAACSGDSVVSIDSDDAGRSIRLEVGQRLDVDLRDCSASYGPPSISSTAVEYTGSDLVGEVVTPGCHTTRHHLVGRSDGTAAVVFRRNPPGPDSVTYIVAVH